MEKPQTEFCIHNKNQFNKKYYSQHSLHIQDNNKEDRKQTLISYLGHKDKNKIKNSDKEKNH